MIKKTLVAALLLLLQLAPLPAGAAQQPDSLAVKIGQMLMIGFRGLR